MRYLNFSIVYGFFSVLIFAGSVFFSSVVSAEIQPPVEPSQNLEVPTKIPSHSVSENAGGGPTDSAPTEVAPANSSTQAPVVLEGALQSSTAKVEKSDDQGTRGKFSVTMYTLGGVDDQQLKKYNKSSFSIYDSYISFNYKINKDVRLAARPAFAYTTAGSDFRGNEVTDKISNRDFSFIATQYNLFEDELPTSMELKHSARLYLPSSESSKIEGMIARLRYEFETKIYSGRYDYIRAWLKPSYYFQRTTAFIDDFGNTRQTRNTDSTHGAEYNLNLNKVFSIVPGFEFEEKWSYSSQENQCGTARRPVDCDVRRSTQLAARLGLEVRPLKRFNFTLGIQDQRDLINTKADKNISYSLLTNLVLY